MPTVRDDIALIRESVKSLNTDTRMHNKFVYDKLLNTTKLILRRETEMRKIYRASEMFKPLKCVDMIYMPTASCTNIIIPGCSYISRSKDKLPEMFITPSGSVVNAYSIDQSQQFIQTTSSIYTDIAKREFKSGRYFWIEDGFLYMPEQISKVLIKGIFINSNLVEDFNSGNANKCYKFMDADSFIPQWLREDVFNVVINSIAGVTKRIPEDENVNSNSNN